MEMKEELREYIAGNFVIDEDVALKDEDNFFALGFVNSLFAMKLVNFIEQKFEVSIGNDDLDISNFNTISNIVALVGKKKAL